MTDDQILICNNLSNARLLAGGFDKRFIKQVYAMATHTPEKVMSEKQIEWMYRLLYKYRKQLPKTYERFKNVPECSRVDAKNKTI